MIFLMCLSLISILASRNGDPVIIWEWKEWKFSLRHGLERPRMRLGYNIVKPLLIKILFGVIPPVAFVVHLVLVESYIMKKPALPVDEHPYAVGQWSPWVSACIVLTAAAITQTNEWKGR